MSNRLFTLAGGAVIGAILTTATLLSCQHMGNHESDRAATQQNRYPDSQPASAPSDAASAAAIAPGELRRILADMAHSHSDKIKLAWWVSTPLRPVDAPFQPFFENMSRQHKQLLADLQAWAKQHHVDLTYRPANDFDGRADQIMDDRQTRMLKADDKTAFEHDILVQMYNDYESNLSQVLALLPAAKDPALQAYLENSRKMYSDGSSEIVALLHRYKFQ